MFSEPVALFSGRRKIPRIAILLFVLVQERKNSNMCLPKNFSIALRVAEIQLTDVYFFITMVLAFLRVTTTLAQFNLLKLWCFSKIAQNFDSKVTLIFLLRTDSAAANYPAPLSELRPPFQYQSGFSLL